MEYGGCSRFWYGGDGGNRNNFDTKEACNEICVDPIGKAVIKENWCITWSLTFFYIGL